MQSEHSDKSAEVNLPTTIIGVRPTQAATCMIAPWLPTTTQCAIHRRLERHHVMSCMFSENEELLTNFATCIISSCIISSSLIKRAPLNRGPCLEPARTHGPGRANSQKRHAPACRPPSWTRGWAPQQCPPPSVIEGVFPPSSASRFVLCPAGSPSRGRAGAGRGMLVHLL